MILVRTIPLQVLHYISLRTTNRNQSRVGLPSRYKLTINALYGFSFNSEAFRTGTRKTFGSTRRYSKAHEQHSEPLRHIWNHTNNNQSRHSETFGYNVTRPLVKSNSDLPISSAQICYFFSDLEEFAVPPPSSFEFLARDPRKPVPHCPASLRWFPPMAVHNLQRTELPLRTVLHVCDADRICFLPLSWAGSRLCIAAPVTGETECYRKSGAA